MCIICNSSVHGQSVPRECAHLWWQTLLYPLIDHADDHCWICPAAQREASLTLEDDHLRGGNWKALVIVTKVSRLLDATHWTNITIVLCLMRHASGCAGADTTHAEPLPEESKTKLLHRRTRCSVCISTQHNGCPRWWILQSLDNWSLPVPVQRLEHDHWPSCPPQPS